MEKQVPFDFAQGRLSTSVGMTTNLNHKFATGTHLRGHPELEFHAGESIGM